ncbi:hypothetical protein [Rhodococcus sp. OK519]|uniref:hypothetical protein n=1 Tax=Rhodococcus sp. OK519 TaxID=2135729 RepID=UPI0011B24A5A
MVSQPDDATAGSSFAALDIELLAIALSVKAAEVSENCAKPTTTAGTVASANTVRGEGRRKRRPTRV